MAVDEGKASSSGKSDSKDSGNDNKDAAGKTNDKSSDKTKDKDAKIDNGTTGKSDDKSPDKNKDKDAKSDNGTTDKANDKSPDKTKDKDAKSDNSSQDKSKEKEKEKEKEKVAKSDNDTKEVRKLFDHHVKAGDPHRINSGLSMENTKNWFKQAEMINAKFGITEAAFEEAFKETAKGEDKNQVEFLEFIECIEMLADEISKTPQDLYNQLLSAEKPAQTS